ncbi:RidA family protein [Fulvivirga sp. M361]|uniref:RidA family protein n=1 Tax=Fulvivirga sp. M361 TaxID=2594266 RepID=UPI00117B7A2C|nr:RidA family protein [Fulvivirga sp. M361]TRX58856.1 RidA family protein [Fulvivirga sp. M361]
MNKESINPNELFNSMQYGFSQIVTCKPGKLVFMSGQVAWDEDMNIVGAGDLEKQMKKAMDNLKIAIGSVGGSLENIVMLRIYIVDYKQEDGEIISKVLKETFGLQSPPASTWINVKGLANDAFMIEIEAEAVV